MSENNTEFKDVISLEAILAATSKTTATNEPIKKEKIEVEIKEEIKPVEELQDLSKIPNDPIVEVPKPIEPTLEEDETEAYKTALKLIEFGTLKDFPIQVSEDDEEGKLISEFKTLTDEDLKEILKIQKQENDTEVSTNYISKEGLKEHQLKVIEILKNGGDLSQIADTKEKAFERPFEGLSLDNQQHQVDILYTDLMYHKQLDQESAKILINKEIEKGTLADSATKIFNAYRESHENYINEKLAEQKKEQEFKNITFKENQKALTAKLKGEGIKESVYRKITSEYSKKNSQGESVILDRVRDILNSPEDNYELILHLVDKETFNNLYKIKASQETQKHIVKLANRVSSKGNSKTIKRQTINTDTPWSQGAEAYNNSINNN